MRRKFFRFSALFLAVLLLIPFLMHGRKIDKTPWRDIASAMKAPDFAVFAPVPYGPFETVAVPYRKPSREHWFGTDHAGRDVLSRMIYGARVSLAVGFLATGIAMSLGTVIGLFAGYKGGKTDLLVMRLVEIVICFPTFLLLLILMSIMLDYGSRQSILLVILVIGLTGWTGLCRLVRGETLKARKMEYIQSCEAMGTPVWRILLFHLLPNVSAPIFVSFTFEVAGAILAESSLSFLGFGVQDPTSSWGELLRQAFPDLARTRDLHCSLRFQFCRRRTPQSHQRQSLTSVSALRHTSGITGGFNGTPVNHIISERKAYHGDFTI